MPKVAMIMAEKWEPINGFAGMYEVSNFGRVRSVDRFDSFGRFRKGGLRKLRLDCDGYVLVTLSKENRSYTRKVHRLVAEAFIPNPERLPQVNHLDEHPGNNFVTNLEWCTAKQNANYGNRNQRMSKALTHPILQLTTAGKLIKKWQSARDAEIHGYEKSGIYRVARGEWKTHAGYVWEYAEEDAE
jgi:hypothetical protein